MKNSDISARKSNAVARGVGMLTQIYAERALNAEFWDVEGTRYIDFASGIAVLNTGHRHPEVMAAAEKQLQHFTHTCHQIVPYENYVHLAERLNAAVPGDFDKRTIFVSTGAEALENAVKIVRAATGREAVIAFNGAFHGRTFMTMSLTGKVQPYKAPFGPMVNGVYHVPFPIDLHGVTVDDTLAAIHQLFKSDVSPEHVAAILIEPVQGEGGFYPAPTELMTALRSICDEHGIVMIADEVQTGFARTGTLFAMEQHQVKADITTMAKSLSGGFPLAAVTGKAEIMNAPGPGGLGGTFGGNPLGIAAAHAVLDVIEKENLCDRANTLGQQLKGVLGQLKEEIPELAEVRGPGFMVAAEFMKSDGSGPDAEFAKRVREEALKRSLLLLTCGVYGNVIRFLSPLTIEQPTFDEAMAVLKEAMTAAKLS